LPSIMFVDIRIEKAHVNKRYANPTQMLTRTRTINVYFTDIQCLLIYTSVQKVKQK